MAGSAKLFTSRQEAGDKWWPPATALPPDRTFVNVILVGGRRLTSLFKFANLRPCFQWDSHTLSLDSIAYWRVFPDAPTQESIGVLQDERAVA